MKNLDLVGDMLSSVQELGKRRGIKEFERFYQQQRQKHSGLPPLVKGHGDSCDFTIPQIEYPEHLLNRNNEKITEKIQLITYRLSTMKHVRVDLCASPGTKVSEKERVYKTLPVWADEVVCYNITHNTN